MLIFLIHLHLTINIRIVAEFEVKSYQRRAGRQSHGRFQASALRVRRISPQNPDLT